MPRQFKLSMTRVWTFNNYFFTRCNYKIKHTGSDKLSRAVIWEVRNIHAESDPCNFVSSDSVAAVWVWVSITSFSHHDHLKNAKSMRRGPLRITIRSKHRKLAFGYRRKVSRRVRWIIGLSLKHLEPSINFLPLATWRCVYDLHFVNF